MAEDKLTDKQRRFCEEYVIDWNATRAAKVAGYSENTAQQIGSENLLKPVIQDYIEEVQKDLSKLTGVTAARNILELKKMAYTNMSDFKKGWMTEVEFEELSDDTKAALSEIQYTKMKNEEGFEKDIVKFKLHDKQKAIDMLNKMLGYNAPEKLQIEDAMLSEEDRLRRIADLQSKLKKGE